MPHRLLLILDVASGALFIALSIPLILRKVKPNIWYGFRTPRTLSDGELWYDANQFGGKALLVAGLVMIVAGAVLYWVATGTAYGRAMNDATLLTLWLVVTVAPVLLTLVASLWYLRSKT